MPAPTAAIHVGDAITRLTGEEQREVRPRLEMVTLSSGWSSIVDVAQGALGQGAVDRPLEVVADGLTVEASRRGR